MTAIAVERHERSATVDDAKRAIDAIGAGVGMGVWLGCDVAVDGLYRREAMAALDPLLAFYLDGALLRVVPQGGVGRALAERVAGLAPFERVDGRLEFSFVSSTVAPHPVVGLLRQVLRLFADPPRELGFYGALAFDYYRLAGGDALPDDGRRRLAFMLPARVLATGDAGHRWIDLRFPELAPLDGPDADLPPVQADRSCVDQPPGTHAAAVAIGVERMRRGELASLVLSQTFRRDVAGADPADAFARLRRDNPYPAMFFVNAGGGERIFGASPDVQVRADATWVETAPVCGTFRRGRDALDDYEQAKALLNSALDEASLAVCADSDRNDKAVVCEPGSVELVSRRRIHFFATIIHAIDHTRGRRRSGVDGFDIVLAHATPATVTGMPKSAARKAIAEIEAEWRGWYAGAAVRIGADGSCEALTMLRFARLVEDCAEVRCGGSLLADSDPVREEEETRIKSETLFRVLAGGSPRAASAPWRPSASHLVGFQDGGDPLAPLMRETLVKAGCAVVAGSMSWVSGDGPLPALRAQLQDCGRFGQIVINNSALALFESLGSRLEALDSPEFGRTIECVASADGFLRSLGRFQIGVYATHVIREDELPAGWTVAAIGTDRRVVAAVSDHGQVALVCRPDSVLSMRGDVGLRMLDAALAMIASATSRIAGCLAPARTKT